MVGSQASASFRDLLLRYRGRTGLTQRQLADCVGAHRRSVQEWENGASYPSAERLERLLRALLETRGLTAGQEAAEAQALWAAVEREAPHTRAPFDPTWFARLLAERTARAEAPEATRAAKSPAVPLESAGRRQDWGEAPDTRGFVGRADELLTLGRWVLDERCRLVVMLGLGGIGKTMLTAKLAHDVAPSFERVYWRSLRDVLPASDWLAGAIGFLSDQQVLPPAAESERLTTLLRLLRERRCLLVLDNLETLFEPGQEEGQYRADLAGYRRLLQVVGEASHQSCLLLTSREAPPELATLSDETGPVRTLGLEGLSLAEGQALLGDRALWGDEPAWADLIATYAGNSLALKVTGETIRQVFGGDIAAFIAYLKETYGTAVRGIRRVMEAQVERRLAPVELDVLRRLAVAREPATLATLMVDLGPTLGRGAVLEAVESLRRRSLVERAETPGAAAFTLQSVVLEYVTDRVVEAVADEIERGQPVLLIEQPLINAQAKDYVRQSQEWLIGTPILQELEAHHGGSGTEQRLLALLDVWRHQPAQEQGYGPGNVVNLLRLLRGHLRGLDLSRLAVRHGYLAEVEAQDASLVDAHLAETVLAEAFSVPLSVALSSDGTVVAAGTTTGEVWLWHVADRRLLAALEGHTGPVPAVALAAGGRLVASGGTDRTVRLWDTACGQPRATLHGATSAVWAVALTADGGLLASGDGGGLVWLWDTRDARLLATLHGHTGVVRGVALAADGHLAASGSEDGTVRLWETETGRPLATLRGHTGGVLAVALSADSRLLASAGADETVRLWDVSTGEVVATLRGHSGTVRALALSAENHLIASGAFDGTVRLWDTSTGQPVGTPDAHTSAVRGVSLAADGRLLASASADGTLRLWDTRMGRPLASLHGHTSTIRGVALSMDGDLVASGAFDGTVRLWDTMAGRLVATLAGHTGGVYSVALADAGRWLASGGADSTVRLWEVRTGAMVATLRGHSGVVWGVALAADGRLVASGSEDGTVRLWDPRAGQPLATLRGHTSGVLAVALSADGRLLASGGADTTARVWDARTGQCVAILQGHVGVIWSVALAADGHLVATGGEDGSVRLWEAATGQQLSSLEGHTGGVYGVALSADGQRLVSGSADGTVRLWDAGTGAPLTALPGNTSVVYAVALGSGSLAASGGADGTIRLWEASTGTPRHVLRSDRRYERMDITGLTGVTAAQRAALLALGAREQAVAAHRATP